MSERAQAILVVEDDRKTAASIRLYLEHGRFDVTVAHTGREGLAAARARAFDLVVLDLMLPEIDGFAICRAIRAESTTPVLMLTARSTESDTLDGLGAGGRRLRHQTVQPARAHGPHPGHPEALPSRERGIPPAHPHHPVSSPGPRKAPRAGARLRRPVDPGRVRPPRHQPLLFAPGKGNEYSNAGFIVLGLIIEKLSGTEYADYVTQHVFAPAGMLDTGLFEQDAVTRNRATGYTKRAGPGRRTNVYTLPARSSSARGRYSTAPDLLRLDVALRTDKLLNPEWTEWVLGDKSGNPPAHATPGHRLGGFGFAGGSPGVNGVVEMDLVGGTTVIVLSNLDPLSAETVGRRIRKLLPRR